MDQKIFYIITYYETKSFKFVQVRYRWKFNFITFQKRSQIFKLVKNVEAHGICEERREASSLQSGPPITQEEYSCIINNFAQSIKQCLKLIGWDLEHVF